MRTSSSFFTLAALAMFGTAALLAPATAAAQCTPQPLTGCKQGTVAEKGKLKISVKDGVGDKLLWKLIKGEETLPEDLGDPLNTTSYTVCIYDTTAGTPALELEATVASGGTCDGDPCWKQTGNGFKYKDKAGASSGITNLLLKAGIAGKSKVVVKGKGDPLDTPDLPFDQDPNVIVQLSNSAGTCWEARFSGPSENADDGFKDKPDGPITGPTATATPTLPGGGNTPTPTNTPGGGGACGNNVLEPGETCALCPADCVVQACTPTGPTIAFTMTLVPPAGQSPTDASVRLGYHSGKLSIPGTGSAAEVLARVTAPAPAPNPFIRNDQNYALAVTLGRATPLGVLFTVTFDRCQGAPVPTVADLGCSIEGCASGGPPIEGCGCTVSQP